jgi:NAD(P)-dependent dehydrogenase (short-subunit alcohol dehydrogenase family)
VVVTGSGHGIGEGLAARFVEDGAATVDASDIDETAMTAVADRLRQPSRVCDVGDGED